MSKIYFLIAAFVISVGIANADIYSTNRQMNFEGNQAAAVNKYENEIDITNVIKEKPEVPASRHKSTFSYEKGKMDASSFYGQGGTNIPAGVNESKTMYTDNLGRLHFFGKGNIIKD